MILNAKKISSGTVLECDVCIVGAGAAGITLALELAATQKRVMLLEAGGLNRSGPSQRLYRGELADPKHHLPLDRDRYRQLGGTTSLWGRRCIPFDTIDFEARSYVPYSGWPISKAELNPYYHKAHDYCECGDYNYNSATALPESPAEMISGFCDDEILTQTIERWSPPTHFGKTFREALQNAHNIEVYLNGVCTQILLHPDGKRVTSLEVHTFNGRSIEVRPAQVVLSGGGLEVTRLLLASNRVHRNGIGNHSDWLGRGYMCHINGVAAKVAFNDQREVIYGYELDKDGVYCRRRLWISEAAQREHQILNTHILLDRPLMEDPSHENGMLSLAFLAKQVVHRPLQHLPLGGKYALYWRHALNILSGSPEILMVLPKWFRNRFVQGRRIPSLVLRSKTNTYHLYYHSEQAPDRASRVTLSREQDRFGMPRIFLDYRINSGDAQSVLRAHQLLDKALRKNGVGHLIYESEDPLARIQEHEATLGHHIGTTRMAADSRNGVVDADCRVHGVANLYVASSSVFPTSSQANPTLTIVALAIRLAGHLKRIA